MKALLIQDNYYITEGKQKKPYCAVCAFTCKAPKKVEEKGKGKKAKTEEVIPPVKVDEENKLDQWFKRKINSIEEIEILSSKRSISDIQSTYT